MTQQQSARAIGLELCVLFERIRNVLDEELEVARSAGLGQRGSVLMICAGPPRASGLMQQRAPVTRNAALRTRYRLILSMGAGRRQLGAVNGRVPLVVVEPILTRLKAGNHRMAGLMKVLSRVLARRSIATADVPAFGATPQVQPPSAACQALDTAISSGRYIRVDAPNVPVLLFHRRPR